MEQIVDKSDESESENTLYNFETKTSKLFLNQNHMLDFLHLINKHKYLIEIKTKNLEFYKCIQLIINNNQNHIIEYEIKHEILIIKAICLLCCKDTIMIKHIQEDNQMTAEFDLCLKLINVDSDEYLLYTKYFYEINKLYKDNKQNLDDSISKIKEIEINGKETNLLIPTKYISIEPENNQLFCNNYDIFNFDCHITSERLSLLKEVNEFLHSTFPHSVLEIIGPMGIGKSASLSFVAFYLKHCLKRNCFYFNFGNFKNNNIYIAQELYYELVVFLYEQIKNDPKTNLFTLVDYLKEHRMEQFFISLVKLAENFQIQKLVIILDQLNILDKDSLQYLGINFLVDQKHIKKIFCNSNNNKGVRERIEMGLSKMLIPSRITKELSRCYSDYSFQKFMIENKLKIKNAEGEKDTYEFIKKHTNYNPFLYSQIGEKLKFPEIDKNGYLIFFAKECETLFNVKCKKFYEHNVKDSEKYNMFYELVHVFVDEERQMTCSQLKKYFPVFDCKLFYFEGTNGVIFNILELKEDNKLFFIKGICPYIKYFYCNLFINEENYLGFLINMYKKNTNPSVKGFYYEQIFKQVVSNTINKKETHLCIDKKLKFEISKKLTPYSFISLDKYQLTDIQILEIEKSIFISPFLFNEKYFDAYIIRKNMSEKFDLFMLSVTISDSHDIVGITELQKCDSLLNKLIESGITLENVYVYYIVPDKKTIKLHDELKYGLITMETNGTFELITKKPLTNLLQIILNKNIKNVHYQTQTLMLKNKVNKTIEDLRKVNQEITMKDIILKLAMETDEITMKDIIQQFGKKTILGEKHYMLLDKEDYLPKYYTKQELERLKNTISIENKKSEQMQTNNIESEPEHEPEDDLNMNLK